MRLLNVRKMRPLNVRKNTLNVRNRVVQIHKKQTTPKIYSLRHRGIISIHQPRPSQHST